MIAKVTYTFTYEFEATNLSVGYIAVGITVQDLDPDWGDDQIIYYKDGNTLEAGEILDDIIVGSILEVID